MFARARLELTAWYLFIIMTISVLFSILIYSNVNQEFVRFERAQERFRTRQQELQQQGYFIFPAPSFDNNMIQNSRIRVVTTLGFINIVILVISGAAGYFLAGRTLRPIQRMVDEQKRFVADASHELRTPLTSLRSEIEVALRNKNFSEKDSRKILGSNLEEVVRLQALSDNLLELSQNGEAITKSNFTTFSIETCIDSALRKLEPLIREKNIKIVKKITDARVNGIPDRISEVFVILLDNSIKYSSEKSTVRIISELTKSNIEIHIKDEGIGIAKKDLPHIFDRFYRASKSRSNDQTPGYGLGLSIAKKIIEAHGGEINVESKVGKGTIFTVQIPI